MRFGKQFAVGILVALVTVLLLAPLATAAEIKGKVQTVDMSAKAITLADGTKLKVADAAQLRDVKPGVNVKASYEDRDGEKVATSIQVEKDGASMPGGARPSPAPQRTQ
ncbi:MAG: DUF1344 domain-containing protein [Candidatus Rokuibacteriota bacterium]